MRSHFRLCIGAVGLLPFTCHWRWHDPAAARRAEICARPRLPLSLLWSRKGDQFDAALPESLAEWVRIVGGWAHHALSLQSPVWFCALRSPEPAPACPPLPDSSVDGFVVGV
jgi:hypothetical protein